jgi:hypothetical protein
VGQSESGKKYAYGALTGGTLVPIAFDTYGWPGAAALTFFQSILSVVAPLSDNERSWLHRRLYETISCALVHGNTAIVRDFLASIAVTGKDEAAFYAELGLDDAFAVCAVGDELEQRFGFAGRKGWGFSVEDMVSLGLANTVYLGRGRYERDSTRFRRYLAQISADDCRDLMQ